MSVWEAVRRELTGVWRSVRYDVGRRGGTAGGPGYPEYDSFVGGPRRLIVSAGLVALVVGGGVGSYFAVVNGLGALLRPKAVQQPGPPPAIAAGAAAKPGAGSPGRPAASRGPAGPTSTKPVPVAAGVAAGVVVVPGGAVAQPGQPGGVAAPGHPVPTPTCLCSAPPVPVPTPASPGPTDPSPAPSPPDPSPSPVEPSPTASGDAGGPAGPGEPAPEQYGE